MSCVKKYAFKNGHALKILKSTSLCLNDKTTPRGKESRKMVTSKILKNIIYQNDFPEKNKKKKEANLTIPYLQNTIYKFISNICQLKLNINFLIKSSKLFMQMGYVYK